MNKTITLGTLFLILCGTAPTHLQAECECIEDRYGYAYQDCCDSCQIAPYVAVGTIAVLAIIGAIVHNSNGRSRHAHAH